MKHKTDYDKAIAAVRILHAKSVALLKEERELAEIGLFYENVIRDLSIFESYLVSKFNGYKNVYESISGGQKLSTVSCKRIVAKMKIIFEVYSM